MASSRADSIGSLRSILDADPYELYNRVNLENMSVGEFLRGYAFAPGALDSDSRSSFREDNAISAVASMLGSHNGDLNVADICCGVAPLARRITASVQADCNRICFWAIDRDPLCIDTVRADSDCFVAFKKFVVLQREIGDLSDLKEMDLVIINNTFHELPPSMYPQVLSSLNQTLNRDRGRITIVDMEELPDDSAESIAISWSTDEISKILASAGFVAPMVTHHQKSVGVYRAELRHSAAINEMAALSRISELLTAKFQAAIQRRRKLRITDKSSAKEIQRWIVETGYVARLAEEIDAVRSRLVPVSE